jgi:hypothetical protein
MRVTIADTFDIAPDAYASLYFEETFAIALCESARIKRTLLRLDRSPARVVRHVRCEPVRDIPAPFAKLIEGGAFHYVEELDFDLGALRGRWRVVPSVLPDRVDASGTLAFEGGGAAGGSVKRVVRGEVNVSVLGVGGLVERFVVGEVEKSYAAASAFTRSYISDLSRSASR